MMIARLSLIRIKFNFQDFFIFLPIMIDITEIKPIITILLYPGIAGLEGILFITMTLFIPILPEASSA